MTDHAPALRFDILEQGRVVETREFDRDRIQIGRRETCELRLDRSDVARLHAVVERDPDGTYRVVDLGSAGGTWLDSERVDGVDITDGDELRFGETTVRICFVAPRDAREATTDAADDAGATSGESRETHPSPPRGQRPDGGRHPEPVTTEDGREVEPYTLQGYYDAGGNYIPGFYDQPGEYRLGYPYLGEKGDWKTAFGYYDPSGEWVPTDEPVRVIEDAGETEAARTGPIWQRRSDREEYTDAFFADRGGDTLEVAHLWGDHVLSVTNVDGAHTVTIGPDQRSDFRVGEQTVEEQTPLVALNSQWLLAITPGMRGHIRRGDDEYSIAQMIDSGAARPASGESNQYFIPLGPETSARVEIDGNTFLVHFTRMPSVDGAGLDVDREPVPYQAGSAAVHILFLLAAMALPGQAGDLSLDESTQRDRFAGIVVQPEQEDEKKDPTWAEASADREAPETHGSPAEASSEASTESGGQSGGSGASADDDATAGSRSDEEVANRAGTVGVLQGESAASPLGAAGEVIGSDTDEALDTLDGDRSEPSGPGLGDFIGEGRSGGEGDESVDIDDPGDGLGGPPGRETGPPSDLGENRETQRGPMETTGQRERETIQRVVRQHRREMKYCYEKELQTNPGLEGRVVVEFTIAPSGEVVAALVDQSTLENAEVENCMQNKIRHWTFPPVDDVQMAKVSYPFNFSPE